MAIMNKQAYDITVLAERFLSYKRSLGFKYETGEFYLRSFLKYTIQKKPEALLPDKEIVSGWCQEATDTPGSLYNRIAVLREFSKYLVLTGHEAAYVIPQKHGNRLEPHQPYFFTPDEVSTFFNYCDSIVKRKESPGRELVVPAIFRLLYCCGLRCREARLLLCSNVCLEQRYMDIIQSKGPKSRRIFISTELAEKLHEYDKFISCIFPNRIYFFPRNRTKSYQKCFITSNFNKIWLEAFPNFDSPVKPRAYDFRHHFAYNNLNRWAKQEKDVNVMLAYLMRYMGHSHIKSTLYYFHFVPEFFGTFIDKTQILESVLPEVSYEE